MLWVTKVTHLGLGLGFPKYNLPMGLLTKTLLYPRVGFSWACFGEACTVLLRSLRVLRSSGRWGCWKSLRRTSKIATLFCWHTTVRYKYESCHTTGDLGFNAIQQTRRPFGWQSDIFLRCSLHLFDFKEPDCLSIVRLTCFVLVWPPHKASVRFVWLSYSYPSR